jgi:hypothetical protein
MVGVSTQTFLEEIKNCSVGLSIEFIPSIQHGIIDVPTFRKCLRRHHEIATNTIGVSIVRIGRLDVSIQCMGTTVTLAKMIKQLQHNGKPLICGIKLTKFTNTEGHYLLFIKKALVNKTEEKFDKLIENLAKEGHLDKFQIDGKFLCHINQVQSKAVATYAASLKVRFKPPETVHVPPNPRPSTLTRNAWNHTPSLKFNQENFPDLEGNVTPSRRNADNKQRTELGSQSVNTSADDSSLSPHL